ncbi:MAG TPA: TIGR03118 family protein, partial [Candidatus Kapabacteria bacterium]
MALAALLAACSSSTTTNPPSTVSTHFTQTNLVSDTAAISATYIDANLLNAWGIAFGPTGKPWIASNHGSVSTIYDTTGATVLAPVSIPVPGATTGGAPSGTVYNPSSTDFGGNKFLFSTEDGTICGWASGTAATIVSDQSS